MLSHALCALTCALWLAPLLAQDPAGPPEVIPDDPLFERQVSLLNPGGELSLDTDSRRPSPRSFRCERNPYDRIIIQLNSPRALALAVQGGEDSGCPLTRFCVPDPRP